MGQEINANSRERLMMRRRLTHATQTTFQEIDPALDTSPKQWRHTLETIALEKAEYECNTNRKEHGHVHDWQRPATE